MTAEVREQLGKDAEDLTERIREYSHSQVELWQQVPFLAYISCERMRREGVWVSPFDKIAAEWGYKSIGNTLGNPNAPNLYCLFVDLETGDILEGSDSTIDVFRTSANDHHLLGLASSLYDLDAGSLVQRFKARAALSVEKQEEWRKFYKRESSLIRDKNFLESITL